MSCILGKELGAATDGETGALIMSIDSAFGGVNVAGIVAFTRISGVS